MSYEIIYDKQFVKAEKDGKEVFFPMIYGGSNNCIQFDRSKRGRRERSWFLSTYLLKGKRFGTIEEMIESVEAERLRVIEQNKKDIEYWKSKNDTWSEYSDDRWGYFTSLSFGGGCKSTFGQYKGLYVTGCKKALTVEELKEFNVDVIISTSIYSKETVEKFKAAGKKEIFFIPNTSKELIEKLEEFDEYLKDTPYVSLNVTLSAVESEMKRIRRVKFPKQKREKVDVNTLPEYYVIFDVIHRNYLLKFTRNGYRYSHYGKSHCKRIANKKEAERFVKKANEKYREEGRFIVETVVNEGVRV